MEKGGRGQKRAKRNIENEEWPRDKLEKEGERGIDNAFHIKSE